ncbi:MAG: hypothetical protein OMM_04525 [Candidatus Magnetoglobus multicellularis str. Araruama]|uniref:CHAT domain-containing protein n=1 Tax=Candidatus Magnetoglobus multicellularis str. Araruama TaxID=890399 RepID=A0A1V1P113_9BACT|nr:MAG: hypothetical protein OMM_04525 [Candidatus Magnetoglobus multicellularis str. Araruama]
MPSVIKEIQAVQSSFQGDTSYCVLLNEKFTVDNFRNAYENDTYHVLHMSTHAEFGESPEETFLVAYDKPITINILEDIVLSGRYRKNNLNLLTLSACQTARGNEQSALGLGGVAVKAGAETAIATLWTVDDTATSLVMAELYSQLNRHQFSPLKALQKTQQIFSQHERYSHPKYWAAFILIGNWM